MFTLATHLDFCSVGCVTSERERLQLHRRSGHWRKVQGLAYRSQCGDMHPHVETSSPKATDAESSMAGEKSDKRMVKR